MKLKKLFSPVVLAAITLLATLASCSTKAESIEDKIKKYISDDVDVVVALDLKRTLDAAEITSDEEGSLELPGYLSQFTKDMLSQSEKKALNKFLDFKGFDWSNTVLGVKISGKDADNAKAEGILVFSVKDDDTFVDALESETDMSKDEDEDGFTVLSHKKVTVLIKDKVGFLVFNQKGICKSSTAAEIINTWEDEADDKALAEWKLNLLKQEKVCKALVNIKPIYDLAMNSASSRDKEQIKSMGMDKLGSSFGYFDVDVNGLTASLGIKVLDNSGKAFSVPGINTGKIDGSLLDYASSTDIMAAGIGLGDNNELVNRLAENGFISRSDVGVVNQIATIFNNSSAVIAAGPADGIKSFIRPDLGNWHMMLAIRFANSSNAESFIELLGSSIMNGSTVSSDVAGNMSMTVATGMSSEYNYSTGEYETVGTNFKTFYLKHNGSDVVISNSPISRSQQCRLDKSALNGKVFALVADFNKSHPILEQFGMPFGAKALATATASEANVSVSLTGVSGKLIPVLMKFIYDNQDFGNRVEAQADAYAYDVAATDSTVAYAY